MKRFGDIFFSGLAIIVLSPLLLPVIIILKLTGEHYIFYSQPRIGYGGKTFQLLKFATMLKDSPNMTGGDITTRNDPRVLPFGVFLRKTKLNELPQLFNIILGDMSIIGPRPLTPRNFNMYTPEVQKTIQTLRPGLSGLGSIAFRDEETLMARSNLPREECYRTLIAPCKGALECWYAANRSLWLDSKLILLTVVVVFFPATDIRSWLPGCPINDFEILKR